MKKLTLFERPAVFPVLMALGFFTGVFVSKWFMKATFGLMSPTQIIILVASALVGAGLGVLAARLLRTY